MFCTHSAQAFATATVRQRAPRLGIRKNYFFSWVEDFRGFCHEVYTTERDHVSIGIFRLTCKLKRIAEEISDVLNGWRLIIVRENHRVFFFFKVENGLHQLFALRNNKVVYL